MIEKSVSILLICVSVNNMELDDSVSKYIGEKNSDKLAKLKNYDINVLEECLSHGCIKIAQPIKDMSSIANKSKYFDAFRSVQKDLVKQFNKAKNLNYTEFVLSLYENLDFAKFAQLMNVNEKQANDLLTIYGEWKNPDVTFTTFGRSFFQGQNTDLRRVHFEKKEDGNIEIKNLSSNDNLVNTINGLNSKLAGLKKTINSSNVDF